MFFKDFRLQGLISGLFGTLVVIPLLGLGSLEVSIVVGCMVCA